MAAIDGEMLIKRLLVEDNVARLSLKKSDLPAFDVKEAAGGEIWGMVRF